LQGAKGGELWEKATARLRLGGETMCRRVWRRFCFQVYGRNQAVSIDWNSLSKPYAHCNFFRWEYTIIM